MPCERHVFDVPWPLDAESRKMTLVVVMSELIFGHFDAIIEIF
jgi:preprotein translocase subunit SecE